MRKPLGRIASAAILMLCASPAAEARPHHGRLVAHHHSFRQAPYAAQVPYGYQGPGATIFALTARAQREPGVTEELAPDAKQTATGGPVGGVPGFDGN